MVASVQMQARVRIKVWSFGVEILGPKSSSVSRLTFINFINIKVLNNMNHVHILKDRGYS